MIVNYTNLEGRRVDGENWTDLNIVDFDAFIDLLLLACVHKYPNESTTSVWDECKGKHLS